MTQTKGKSEEREALRATWLGHFDIGNPTARLESSRAQRLGRTSPCRLQHVHQALLPALPVSGQKVSRPPFHFLAEVSLWTL